MDPETKSKFISIELQFWRKPNTHIDCSILYSIKITQSSGIHIYSTLIQYLSQWNGIVSFGMIKLIVFSVFLKLLADLTLIRNHISWSENNLIAWLCFKRRCKSIGNWMRRRFYRFVPLNANRWISMCMIDPEYIVTNNFIAIYSFSLSLFQILQAHSFNATASCI